MRYILLLALSLSLGVCQASWVNTEGFVVGQLAKVERVGLTSPQVVRGEILLGRDSGANDELSETSTVNPWVFSAESKLYDELTKQVGSYIIVQFKTPKSRSLRVSSAPNELIAYGPVVREPLSATSVESRTLNARNKEGGVQFGRIVRVTAQGSLSPVHRMTLQVGNSGDKFELLGIDDEKVYDFSAECVKKAARVRVYTVKWPVGSAGTDAYVWRVEAIPDL